MDHWRRRGGGTALFYIPCAFFRPVFVKVSVDRLAAPYPVTLQTRLTQGLPVPCTLYSACVTLPYAVVAID